jgi:hypothetical protein
MRRTLRDPGASGDPTIPIVQRAWSAWLPYEDERGLFPKSEPPTATVPYETPGTARPAIYEIARRKRGRGDPEVLYVGKTTSPSQGVRNRLIEHHSIDDPLYDRIVEALIRHYELFARFILFEPDESAETDRLERELREKLSATRYPWNGR